MKILLAQLDGKLPNIALMRLSAHHKAIGDEVRLHVGRITQPFLDVPDRVYASLIFEKTRPFAAELLESYPNAVMGGTGWTDRTTIEDLGISAKGQDYSIYPTFRQSLGFTQRGCRLRCGFCVVPTKEGAVREENTITDVWRGHPWPRELLLMDNDFFGQENWRKRIEEIREGQFKVSFNQGINARFLTDEAAEAIGSVDYRDDSMKVKRIYTAWDNAKDGERLFAGLERLVKYGVRPDHIMVYMLVGYWPGETHEDREARRIQLRAFGCRPYPMPYVRTPELIGYQRWVIRRIDLMVPWEEFAALDYRPERIGLRACQSVA